MRTCRARRRTRSRSDSCPRQRNDSKTGTRRSRMNAEWRNRYEVAVEATRKAGDLAMTYFAREREVQWKADLSPVTLADQSAEKLLRETLLARFPQDGFLGEEFGNTPGASGYRWIIDPIDGTRSFVRGIPLWGTLVGLEHQGEL